MTVDEIAKPRGTRDMLPVETRTRRRVDETIRKTLDLYSFEEIQTPIFEYLSLFQMRSGEKIKDEMYWFSPPSAELKEEGAKLEYCLRPELTAATCRFFVSGGLSELPKPVKAFYAGPCFRYDTPAPGRYREFYQVGVELIGTSSPKADAEVVTLATAILDALQIPDYRVQINDINILRSLLGDYDTADQNIVLGLIDKYGSSIAKHRLGVLEEITEEELFEEYRGKLAGVINEPPLVDILVALIDLKGGSETLEKARELMSDYPIAVESIDSSPLNEVFQFLKLSSVNSAVLDFSIARGLDYYTGIVFEIDVNSLRGAKQICGGGRYDRLIADYGGEITPATGFAFGFDRLVIAYENAMKRREERMDNRKADVYVVMIKPNPEVEMSTVIACRDAGIRTEFNLSQRNSMKANLTYAQKISVPYVLIQGPREIENERVVLRDMGFLENSDAGSQEEMTLDEAIDRIKNTV